MLLHRIHFNKAIDFAAGPAQGISRKGAKQVEFASVQAELFSSRSKQPRDARPIRIRLFSPVAARGSIQPESNNIAANRSQNYY
jgi:hypothetical protein